MFPNNRDLFATVRTRMVQEQLIPHGITDQRVLSAMNSVPRHLFVEDAQHGQAYAGIPLPIGDGQTISQPYIVALMSQALQLKGEEHVLEIGTGCGYQTTVLSALCEKVYTIERIKPLYIKARKKFDQLHCLNVLSKIDDGTMGWPEYGPYDAIMVTASGPEIPSELIEQLADPGIMVIPVGPRHSQDLIVVTKQNKNIKQECIESVRFVSLIGKQGWST